MNQSMKKASRSAVLACVAMALLATASCNPFEKSTAVPMGDAAPVALKVPVVQAKRTVANGTHVVTGTLQASHQVRIAPRLSARITEILVREGETAKAGQPIVRLDGRELTAKRTQARANVTALQQKLDYLKVQQARIDKLGKQGVAPPSTVDEINVNVLTTESQLVAAKGVLAEAESAFEDLVIRAPFDGRVNQRLSEIGDYALPSEPLMIFEDDRALKATLALSAEESNVLREKATVDVRIDGVDGPRTAKVKAVLASGRGLIPGQRAILEISNEDGALSAGNVVRLDLTDRDNRMVLEVPAGAVEERDGWSGVYVVKDGRLLFSWVTMETAPLEGRPVRILSGLKEGDTVVESAAKARASGLVGQRVTLD